MDAATYKDYIFGMLFLKRCSDVFEAAREEIIHEHVDKGMKPKEAEKKFGDDPDYYDDFFVPESARWPYLQEHLNDAKHPYGSFLDKALAALSEANDSLEHVLDHISFMRIQSNKRIVSDEACKDLVRHFTRYRLRNEDFQFSDLLGSAYEFLINMFAESAGKKGGDFYTPRDVIRLMIRVLSPKPGMSIYDPTCGSGGMLIIGREFIEQSGGDVTNLRLCGQVNDPSAWAICKLNMLLHGIRGADIQLADTLLHPQHREAGELERFDRVLANPPFSQNYTRTNMEFPERFQWGWSPTTGKKADLMFAQHMLAVCKPKGMVATVMPHGVLFRGGAEKEIRKKLLEQDIIEAIIGLPENLFYGASIPACILVMRPNVTGSSPNPNKPEGRRGRILFINADAEYLSRPAQNYLLPEHIEKIASTFERYENVENYARIVSLDEITSPANDCNLNIRRYVDNSPPPEPHDVRAHLFGGVPVAEIDAPAQRALFDSLGFDAARVFADRPQDDRYRDFLPAVISRAAIRPLIDCDTGVQAKEKALHDALSAWWTAHAPRLAKLPQRHDLNAVRADFLKTFTAAMAPLGILDRFKLAGVIATWWTDTIPDFKTLIENGFGGVIDGWVDAIADALEDDDNVGPAFDPFGHKLVQRMMADYLQQIEASKADIARLKGEKEAFEQSNAPDDLDEEELAEWNYAKDLEQRFREVTTKNREDVKALAKLEKAAAKRKATDADHQAAASAREALKPVFDQLASLQTALAPYEKIKEDLAAARSRFRSLVSAFVTELQQRCGALTQDQQQALVLELFLKDVREGLGRSVAARRLEMTHAIERLWEKYAQPLAVIAQEREQLSAQVAKAMEELGYAC